MNAKLFRKNVSALNVHPIIYNYFTQHNNDIPSEKNVSAVSKGFINRIEKLMCKKTVQLKSHRKPVGV